jgi:Flp pilus assembly protein TadG
MPLIGRVRRTLVRLHRSSSGAAALELAVVFPILVVVIIGAVEYGRVFYTSVTVANAARAGAEWGSQAPNQYGDTVGMRIFAQQDGNDAGNLSISANRVCKCGTSADPGCGACASLAPDVFIDVTATKKLAMLLKYPGLPDTVTIARKATFRPQ